MREANIATRKRILEELGILKLASRLPGDHGRQPQPEVGEACAAPPRKRRRRWCEVLARRLTLPREAKKGADSEGYYTRPQRELDMMIAEHDRIFPSYRCPAAVTTDEEEEEEEEEDDEEKDKSYDLDADSDSGDDSNVDSDSDVDTESDTESDDEGPTLIDIALGLDADDDGDGDDAALFDDDDDAPAFDANATVCVSCTAAEVRAKRRSRRRALCEKLKAGCSPEVLAEAEAIRKASLEHVRAEEAKQEERFVAWLARHERAHPKPPEPTARTRTPDARGDELDVETRLRRELEACPRTNAAVEKANAEVLRFRDDVFFETDAEMVAFFTEFPERRRLYNIIPASQVELPTAVIADGGVACTCGSFTTAFATQPAPDTPFAVVPSSSSSSSSPGRYNPSMDMTMRVIPERVLGWTREEYRQRAAHIDLLLAPLPPNTNVRRFLRRFSDENPDGFEAFVVGMAMLFRRLVDVLGGAHRVVPLVLAALRDDGDNVWTTFFAAALTVDAARDALAPLFITINGMRAWLVCTNHPCNYLVAERMPSSAENVARADLALAIAFSFASGTFVACGFARGFLERNGELAALMQAYRRARYLARPKCERDGCELRPSKYHLCFQHRRCEHPGGCGRLATAADRLCDKHGGRRRRRRRKTCATADCRRLATSGDGLCNPCGGRGRRRRRKTCATADCRRLATSGDGLCDPCGGRGRKSARPPIVAASRRGATGSATRAGGGARRARPPIVAASRRGATGSATRAGGGGGRRARPPIVAASRRVATGSATRAGGGGGRRARPPIVAASRRGATGSATRAGEEQDARGCPSSVAAATRADGLCNPCGGRGSKTRAAANCGRLATRGDGLCNPCGGRSKT